MEFRENVPFISLRCEAYRLIRLKMALNGANSADITTASRALRRRSRLGRRRLNPPRRVTVQFPPARGKHFRRASLEFVLRKGPARVRRVNIPHD